MSKQSEIIDKQMKDLAEVAAQLDDNKELQSQIDNRIEVLGRTKAVLEAQEQREQQREQQEAEMRRKLLNVEDPMTKRIQEVADLVGKNSDEKEHLVSTLAVACCANSDMLDKFDYLKGKALSADQIKLVLGL